MSEDSQAQEDELLALASIYDDSDVFSTNDDTELRGGQFSACVELSENFQVITSKTDDRCNVIELSHTIQYLPPITLYFELPDDYPSARPPSFTLSCKWLSLKQLNVLCARLDELWDDNEGMEVLFLWTSLLKEGVLDCLLIESPLNISGVVQRHRGNRRSQTTSKPNTSQSEELTSHSQSTSDILTSSGARHRHLSSESESWDCRAVQDIASNEMLYTTLLDYDKSKRELVFQVTLFTCQVCFGEKLGSLCVKFSGCDHVYCKDCMKGYFEVQIGEGNVLSLTCPYDQCDSQAHPAQVKELVAVDLFSRYERLLLQSSLDTMSDVMYCPRQTCGCALMVDQESGMGTCPSCCYVFCVFCKLGYHGISPCKIRPDDLRELREEYLSADPDKRKQMERRYGRKSIQQVVEESFTQDWLQEYSKKCPKCSTHIQKIDGCNKMTCTKCRCFFCWLCNLVLSRNNPYNHYNSLGSDCFNKLFQGVTIDDEGDEEWEELVEVDDV